MISDTTLGFVAQRLMATSATGPTWHTGDPEAPGQRLWHILERPRGGRYLRDGTWQWGDTLSKRSAEPEEVTLCGLDAQGAALLDAERPTAGTLCPWCLLEQQLHLREAIASLEAAAEPPGDD